MRIDAAHPSIVRDYWHVILPLIKKACARSNGEYDPDLMLDHILDETWVLWVATDPDIDPFPKALAATRLEEWPGDKRVCRLIFVAAERMEDWQHAFRTIQDYARREMCDVIRTEGRAGWQRCMNWTPKAFIYEVTI